MNKYFILFLLSFLSLNIQAQDTFSIVAVDSITGEVGSAGASCVDLTNYPNYTYHFLGELFPGVGAINTQAYYLSQNQANARARMQEGMNPQEIIDWLIANDHQNNPSVRQYGIAGLVDGSPEAAGYTGSNTDDYKNHVTGNHYSIQGNILLGQEVLDQMEANFLAEEGDLACKLMAALQGANMVGADSRCASNGTSSLFAFLKVAQPDDTFGDPSFVIGLKTEDGAGIEPIDSLQIIFDELHHCSGVGLEESVKAEEYFSISPNPAQSEIKIKSAKSQVYQLQIIDESGKIMKESTILGELILNISDLPSGIYFARFFSERDIYIQKIIKQE
jgi:uncharacterized Ntn-hydrolase superfamily protein